MSVVPQEQVPLSSILHITGLKMDEKIDKTDAPRKRGEFLHFGKPHIEEDELEEVVSVLRSGWLTTGAKVNEFEEMFRSYQRAKYAIATNSGTAALHLALLATGVGQGDEVLISAVTFSSVANSVFHTGATSRLCEIELETYNIDPDKLKDYISPRTKAIILSHHGGHPADFEKIQPLLLPPEERSAVTGSEVKLSHRPRAITLISDAAHSIESIVNSRRIPELSDLTGYSFYATKNLTTVDGGMLLTDSEEWAGKAKLLSEHGLSLSALDRHKPSEFRTYSLLLPGYKYRMTDLSAAIGITKLRKLETRWKRREVIWERYNEAFKDLPIKRPSVKPAVKHSFHLYIILLDLDGLTIDRDRFGLELKRLGIGCSVHFPSLHIQPLFKERFGFQPDDLPAALEYSRRALTLPLYPQMSDQDVEDVIAAVTYLCRKFAG